MADTAEGLLDSFDLGKITFDKLVSSFSALPMTAPRSMRAGRNWADVYREAEEGDSTDVPAAISAAKYSKAITDQQAETLLAIYRNKVPPTPSRI